MTAQTWIDVGIEIPTGLAGEIDVLCPQCSHTRKKSRDKCLSVNTDKGTWLCMHCGWSGGLTANRTDYGARLRSRVTTPPPPRVYTTPKLPPAQPLPEAALSWFTHRGIPESVLTAAGITAGQEWCPQLADSVLAVRFPYLRDGALVNIKYRALVEKAFWMVKGAQRLLYGLDDIADADELCIVEGEMDKLSVDTSAGPPTVSVPDGAPPPDATHSTSKFSFLDETAMTRLRGATRVLIGTDIDAPGEKLAQELARRIGYARCARVSWHPYKDANDMLVARGTTAVLQALAAAVPFLIPFDDEHPQRTRPVRRLPPVRGRRPIIELAPAEVSHAR